MTELINEDIIHLQHAHVTQHSNSKGNSPWRVNKNITNETLAELPQHFSEEEVFAIMAFARKFELVAFNEGIRFGKKHSNEIYEHKIKFGDEQLHLAREENERLANKLMQLIAKEEN